MIGWITQLYEERFLVEAIQAVCMSWGWEWRSPLFLIQRHDCTVVVIDIEVCLFLAGADELTRLTLCLCDFVDEVRDSLSE